ncbi:MAG: CinA family protein [Thermodesulfobacteriota bacterium]
MKLEKAIGDRLREKGWTLSIAESCTGGLICDRITDISGSSDYFEGGMVTYSNESKAEYLGVPSNDIRKYGAVSPEVAKKMAQGVRRAFHTTFGLSTTGVAGPTGGTKRSPIGIVFIGLADGKKTRVIKLNLKGNRREIKEKAAEKGLELMYGMLTEKSGIKKGR